MMKTRILMIFSSLLCLLGLTLNAQAGSVVGQQGFINGDWEAAAIDGWVQFPNDANHPLELATTGAHGGAQCGKVTIKAAALAPEAQNAFVQQRVWGPMQVIGSKLRFSGWVKTAWATDGAKTVSLTHGVKNGTGWYAIHALDVRTGDLPAWTYLTGDFVVEDGFATVPDPATTASFLSVRVNVDATGSTADSIVYMDDFALVESTAAFSNVLKNPGFELGLSDWQQFPTTGFTMSTATDSPKGGAQALKVVYPAGSEGYAYQFYNGDKFYVGSKLHFSAWVKASFASAGGYVALYRDIAINDAWGNYFGNAMQLDGNQAAWTKMDAVLDLPAGPAQGTTAPATDYLALRLAGSAVAVTGGDSTVYWDDVMLEEFVTNSNNLFNNPGFELGQTGWQQFPTTGFTVSTVSDNPKEGQMALKVVYPAGSEGNVYQHYNGDKFYVGSKLHFSAWVKASFASAGGYVALYRDIAINDAWGNYFGNAAQLDGDLATWTKIETELDLPVGPAQGTTAPASDYLGLRLTGSAAAVTGGDSTVYWDDTLLGSPEVPNSAGSWELY